MALIRTLLAVVLLAGCGGADVDRQDADRSRQEVTSAAADLKARLASAGTVTAYSGIWSSCSDFGGQVRYAVKGRVDGAVADPLLASLHADGWTDAYDRGESPRRRGVQRDGLSLEVTDYADDTFLLVDLLGPCLATGQELADDLRREDRAQL